MKKNICFIAVCFFLLACTSCYSQQLPKNDRDLHHIDIEKEFDITDFSIISDEANFNKYHLIDSIIPDQYYYYWECIFDELADSRYVYVWNGDSLHFAEKTKGIRSYSGFFRECEPGICFNYIVAIDSSMNILLINSDEKFKKFIGRVDNLSEALLIARLNNLAISNDEKIGGAYKEKEDCYLLYLTEFVWCPVSQYSVRAVLYKTGEFIIIDKKVYQINPDDCIIF